MQNVTGKLTEPAKVRKTKNGRTVTEFTVVVIDSYAPKGSERIQSNTFYRCSYQGSYTLVKHLKKGTIVSLNGTITASSWISTEENCKAMLTCTVSAIKILTTPTDVPIPFQTSTERGNRNKTDGADDNDFPC